MVVQGEKGVLGVLKRIPSMEMTRRLRMSGICGLWEEVDINKVAIGGKEGEDAWLVKVFMAEIRWEYLFKIKLGFCIELQPNFYTCEVYKNKQ